MAAPAARTPRMRRPPRRPTIPTANEHDELPDDPGLAPVPSRSVGAALPGAAGRRGCALPRVRPGRAVPVRAGTQVHAVRCVVRPALRTARPAGLRAQRRRAGDLPRRGQSRAGRRAAALQRQGARRGHGEARRHRRRVAGDARRGCARHALQLRQAARRLHAEGRAAGDRAADRAARLARGRLLRGRRPAGAVGILHRAARPPWSSITWAGPT